LLHGEYENASLHLRLHDICGRCKNAILAELAKQMIVKATQRGTANALRSTFSHCPGKAAIHALAKWIEGGFLEAPVMHDVNPRGSVHHRILQLDGNILNNDSDQRRTSGGQAAAGRLRPYDGSRASASSPAPAAVRPPTACALCDQGW
jgi:hypothetical protein